MFGLIVKMILLVDKLLLSGLSERQTAPKTWCGVSDVLKVTEIVLHSDVLALDPPPPA